jgi:hypothetical protein
MNPSQQHAPSTPSYRMSNGPSPLGNKYMLLAITGLQRQATLSPNTPQMALSDCPIQNVPLFGLERTRIGWTERSQERPVPQVLPLVLLFPQDLTYQVLSKLDSSLAVRRASFHMEESIGTLRTMDGPLQILRLNDLAILAAVTLDDPSRVPILHTSEGAIEPIRGVPTDMTEIEDIQHWDFSWEGGQLAVMNHCVTEARRILGEACFWVPVLPYRSDTES